MQSVSPDKLSMLTAFAALATVPLNCDLAVEVWVAREYSLHPAEWWEREVDIALQKLRFSSYDMRVTGGSTGHVIS